MTSFTFDGNARISPVVHPFGLRVSGEIDRDSHDLLARALAWAVRQGDGDVHLHLGALTFIDVTGLRKITSTAAGLPAPRKLVLDAIRPVVGRLLKLLGWSLSEDGHLYVPANGHSRPKLPDIPHPAPPGDPAF
ncbi:STAS domain-containing protein [Actinomadura sp. ATCC 31491]|uniref:STAS domain-containing protein n=1 Tax=Actinomadura luzonensis TaxID=2805427 RepID=A0ABT0FR80_9ACTN|nr:STAS domain-containing protein [Actinomadura luzonensis]MCK2214805.1 STAS domain-containing protein [Actinomadura luzonensis]